MSHMLKALIRFFFFFFFFFFFPRAPVLFFSLEKVHGNERIFRSVSGCSSPPGGITAFQSEKERVEENFGIILTGRE